MKIKAGIIGVTGYAGVELLRLLLLHPEVAIAAVSSRSFEGKAVADIYPNLQSLCALTCENPEGVLAASDVIFAALPHGLSEPLAAQCRAQDKILIDLGADFRLEQEKDYRDWYANGFEDPALHAQAVYGLPELFREQIRGRKLIANPGCYPTSAALALAPALRKGFISTRGIIIDAKSGVTGAGREPSDTTHFPACNEAFSAYKIASHRHTPEIEQTLAHMAGVPVKVTFTPHLLPLNRGILATIYAPLAGAYSLNALHAAYCEAYAGEPFVRVLPLGSSANLRHVQYSNYCDLSLHLDARTETLIVVSVIDNMVKGAAGQAIQNMNLLYDLPETTGLTMIPPAF